MKPISLQKTPEHTETQILQRNECIITGENDTWGLGTEISLWSGDREQTQKILFLTALIVRVPLLPSLEL